MGDQFQRAFSVIGQLRSLIPEGVHVMALTAMTTKQTFDVVSECLSLYDPLVVATTCNRPNIFLQVQPEQKLDKVNMFISQQMIEKKLAYPKSIFFAKTIRAALVFSDV